MYSSDGPRSDLAPLLELVSDQLPYGILIVDDQTRKVAYCNKKFSNMWNIPDDIVIRGDDREMIDHVVMQLRNPYQFLQTIEFLHNTNQSLSDELEFLDGRIFSRKSIPVNPSSDSRYRAWIFTDITGQSHSNIDRLTKSLNRCAWDQFLEADSHYLAGNNYCFAMVDINDFATINRDLGHEAGDRLLARLGNTLRLLFCGDNDRVFRIGGDRFCAVIITDSDISGKVCNQLSKELITAGLNAALGVCMSSSEYGLLESISTAERRMLYSKNRIKEMRSAYHPAIPLFTRVAKKDNEISMLSDLSVAITKGELHLVYQPIYNQLNEIKWIEAFCRWRHGDVDIPPSTFIPLSETSDLIHRIWDFVLCSTVKDIAEWQNLGKKFSSVSLNFSAVQVEYYKNTGYSYAKQIKSVCDQYGVSPSCLKIELTETSLLNDLSIAKELFDELAELGLALCIDDYGTGFSSLAILQALPIKFLKIDGIFISDVPLNSENTAIARGTISMANELGLEVCAECVQNDSQISFLSNLGCKYFQGFFKCPPTTASEIASLL